MTRAEAIDLMSQYAVEIAKRRPSFTNRPATPKRIHLMLMPTRFPENGSEKKAMRWLGFMQGALWAAGVFTLDELKEHSRTKVVK